MTISAQQVKQLRDKTGAGMMECKKALVDVDGDVDAAIKVLRERGLAAASKRASKDTREGIIGEYVHAGGKLGVIVEVNCETDFVARTPEFQGLVRDLAMQVAASNPLFVSRDEVPADTLERESEIFRNQALAEGKPEHIADKIVEGRLKKYYSEVCLLEQPFIKDSDMTIEEFLNSKIATIKENIAVRRFVRFEVGEEKD
jgi:elongation factor Ts